MREAILKEEEEEEILASNRGTKKVSSMQLMKRARYKPGVNTAIESHKLP